jgi:hypothetical protein
MRAGLATATWLSVPKFAVIAEAIWRIALARFVGFPKCSASLGVHHYALDALLAGCRLGGGNIERRTPTGWNRDSVKKSEYGSACAGGIRQKFR